MAIDCQHFWYLVAPSVALSPDTVAESNPGESVPDSTLVELFSQIAETNDTYAPSQADLADPEGQPGCSDVSVHVLDSKGALISMDPAVAERPASSSPPDSAPLFSGDQPPSTSASDVPAPSILTTPSPKWKYLPCPVS